MKGKRIAILGLSITSSWGNGHASTYRSLVRGLAARGHEVLFLERDVPWYAANRDQRHPPGAITILYGSAEELFREHARQVEQADLVIVGSFVPDGVAIGEWVVEMARGKTAFYDIDTPLTLARLESGELSYINAGLMRRFDCYLSFTGGPTLRKIEAEYGSPMARPLYCSVDPHCYRANGGECVWDLGYLGTYSDDRQPALERLLCEPARRRPEAKFAVVGPQYPQHTVWPANVERRDHLPPGEHAGFYSSQKFTLNLTREPMKRAGFSPSVRLFEAACCGVPILSDWWEGLDTLFAIGREMLVVETADDTLRYLREVPDERRKEIGRAARSRVLAEHTPAQRALQLEAYLEELNDNFPVHTACGNRRLRKDSGGMAARLASKRGRAEAGGRSGEEAVADPAAGGIFQSAGTND